MKKRVLLFGTFDGLHPGHLFFIEQAAALGEELIVVVARDASVLKHKGRLPDFGEEERLARVSEVSGVAEAVLGDQTEGRFEVVQHHMPRLIVVGYDQLSLAEYLRHVMKEGILPEIEIVTISALDPHLYKTSLLRKSSLGG